MTEGIGTDRPMSPLDREEIAKIEVGHTTISPSLARVMVVVFLVTIAALPLVELLAPGAPEAPARPAAPDVAPSAPNAPSARSAWLRLVTANRALLARMAAFETALEDQSAIGRVLRPPTQWALSGWLGAGNERVYIGRQGWLFFRPDVESLTGRGFLDPREHQRRRAAASEYESPPQPDPGPAIRQFHRELNERGIALIVMPTPVKPAIHPDYLADDVSIARDRVLHNASYDMWIRDMREAGVLVFDPSDTIARLRGTVLRPYLATDTHWRPETMQRVAEALASFIVRTVDMPADVSAPYQAERREVRHTGDTTAMLDLPAGQTLYPPELVPLRYIVDGLGNPWRPSRDADVLLLGDSFTNIYSLGTMGWGESAGFAEQLSFVWQRPVDRIVQNDAGAYATRALLAQAPVRLAGKRVVIWQFAARELAFGDWRILPL